MIWTIPVRENRGAKTRYPFKREARSLIETTPSILLNLPLESSNGDALELQYPNMNPLSWHQSTRLPIHILTPKVNTSNPQPSIQQMT